MRSELVWRLRDRMPSTDGCVHTRIGSVNRKGRWRTNAIVDGRRTTVTVQRLALMDAGVEVGALVWAMCGNQWCVKLDHLATGSTSEYGAWRRVATTSWPCGHPKAGNSVERHLGVPQCRLCCLDGSRSRMRRYRAKKAMAYDVPREVIVGTDEYNAVQKARNPKSHVSGREDER